MRLTGKRSAIFMNSPPAWIQGRPAHHLVSRKSEDALCAGVAGSNGALGIHQYDSLLHCSDNRSVAIFALPDGFLRNLPCSDIPGGRVEQLTLRIRGRGPQHPSIRPVLTTVSILELDRVRACHNPFRLCARFFLIVWVTKLRYGSARSSSSVNPSVRSN